MQSHHNHDAVNKRPPPGTVCFICRRVIGKKVPIRLEYAGWRHRNDCTGDLISKLDREIDKLTNHRTTSVRQHLKRL